MWNLKLLQNHQTFVVVVLSRCLASAFIINVWSGVYPWNFIAVTMIMTRLVLFRFYVNIYSRCSTKMYPFSLYSMLIRWIKFCFWIWFTKLKITIFNFFFLNMNVLVINLVYFLFYFFYIFLCQLFYLTLYVKFWLFDFLFLSTLCFFFNFSLE